MRQAGILAAAGIHALEHNIERLADDHARAVRLAEGLARLGVEVEGTPETNIVMFRLPGALEFSRKAAAEGVRINLAGPGRLRAVTHLDIGDRELEEALARIETLLA